LAELFFARSLSRLLSPIGVKQGGWSVHGEEKRFAHIVLFDCPWCLRLLSSAFLSFNEQLIDQLEGPMGGKSTTMCPCGWVGNALDLASASHSVRPWSGTTAPVVTTEVPPAAPAEGWPEKRDWIFLVAKQIESISGQKFESTPP
jgi:hypothetical protein